ncbi:PadR family transcriptional regulator [Sporolactobacillus putidus]|uniref:PadR family transcriptional regulator n=1 Tax=Sporolactobacillus putidus TaxID=492735 RepID=A0A917S798_9BACL|nr:PadR family transcriptional regulator [Sporolactobacillus putidus]GGL61085.1 PadR family transcriptional regulator [Sporolactobacillus putidus]
MVRLMVLGMLKIKSLSGYEIQQILQTNQSDIWAGILPGSIYHALKKMEKEGLVEVDSVEQTGHRIKAIYKITEKGQVEYIRLLKESLVENSVILPGTLYTGLAFLHDLPKDEKLRAFKEQKLMIEKELDKLRAGQKEKEQYVTLDTIARLQFENMFDHCKLQIDFIQKLIDQMEQMDDRQTQSWNKDFQKYFD